MVVTEYYEQAGLDEYLDKLGFNLVGYGCTTCIGNSGPLPEEISEAVNEHDLAVVSVLSGNRNFEGRINPDVKMNYLASPPLCVAYALAGTMDWDPFNDPFPGSRRDAQGHLADRAGGRRDDRVGGASATCSRKSYGEVFEGDERWNGARRARGRPLRVGRGLDVRAQGAVLRGHARRARADRGHRGRARARQARRLGHDRPHLARRRDQEGLARRQVPAGARRRAARVQLLRLAARQPRGDDPRHVREHPPAQPARARTPRAASRATSATGRRRRCRSTTRR